MEIASVLAVCYVDGFGGLRHPHKALFESPPAVTGEQTLPWG